MAVAQARLDDFRRTADASRTQRGRAQPAKTVLAGDSVTIRFASTADQKSLARLTALDSADALERPVLLAEVDGALLAALSLCNGAVVADPFHRTVDLASLLRATAHQIEAHSSTRPCGRLRSWARLCRPTSGESVTTVSSAG
jgi:hypothetical protein